MALFKVFRGKREDLEKVTKVDGHAYFCTDDGSFWIDYSEGNNNIVYRKQVNENDLNKINIDNGEGSGSIQQIGYTQEGLYKDFRHYAAAYGIVSASGGEVNPETIEATMTAYTYEQLLGMIAQANFGGDTATAQAYIDSMITSELEGFDITKANKVEGTAATALGVGNTVYSPGAIAVGYDNEIGLKGYPQNALFSAAIGENNSVQNKASIAIGKDLIVEGSCSAAIGKATTYSPADYEVADGKADVIKYFENLKELKPTINSFVGEEASSSIPEGTIDDSTELELNKLYGETSILVGKSNAFASNSITVGYANSAYGLNSATFGNQNINAQLNSVVGGSLNVAGYDGVNKQLNLGSALFGSKNKAINNYIFAAGLENTVEGEYGTAVGLANNVKATLASSAGEHNEIEKTAPCSFVGGTRNKAINANQTVFGKLNKGIENTLFEIGNGWEEINNITWKEVICTFNTNINVNTIDFRGYDPAINYTLYIKSIKKNGEDLIDFKNQIIHDFIEFPENSPRASAKIVKDNNGVEVLALSNVWFSVNRFWSFKIKTADNIFKANDIIRVEYYLYSGDKYAKGEVAFNKTYLSGISQSIYGEQIKPNIEFIRSNAFEITKDGTATAKKLNTNELYLKSTNNLARISLTDAGNLNFTDVHAVNTIATQEWVQANTICSSTIDQEFFNSLY